MSETNEPEQLLALQNQIQVCLISLEMYSVLSEVHADEELYARITSVLDKCRGIIDPANSPAPQWTAEPPKEDGWYVSYCDERHILNCILNGWIIGHPKVTVKEYVDLRPNVIWFPLPPLPERKESNE